MNTRQQEILRLIIEEYIRSAEPVGSAALIKRHNIGVSSATVRNDMASLEADGFLRQPHTSAGRVPTEMAYLFYLQHVVGERGRSVRGTPLKDAVEDAQESRDALKGLAKSLVAASGETAFVAIRPRWSYYTGVSNLLSKPDFGNVETLRALSQVIDRFDETLQEILDMLPDSPIVLIGQQSPFGPEITTMVVRYQLPSNDEGLIGLMGPMRMDYRRNLALIHRAKDVLDQFYQYE